MNTKPGPANRTQDQFHEAESPRSDVRNAQAYKRRAFVKLGTGFFADAYDLFVVDIVLSILDQLAKLDASGLGYSYGTKAAVAAATSAGSVIGTLAVGYLGEALGRKGTVAFTGLLITVSSILSCLVIRSESFPLMYQLATLRFLLGVGTGIYPLSAAVTSEMSSQKTKAQDVILAFSMQGVGMIASAALGVLFMTAKVPLDAAWRALLIVGLFPDLTACYFCAFSKKGLDTQNDGGSAANPCRVRGLFASDFEFRSLVIGTSLAGFLTSVTLYGTGEFKHLVARKTISGRGLSAVDSITTDCLFGLIIGLMAMPGYALSYCSLNVIGKFRRQVLGFVGMSLCFIMMGVALELGKGSKCATYFGLLMFGLSFLFTNFGPNSTTLLIPTKVVSDSREGFPVLDSSRTTCVGISSAVGKLGAAVGAVLFPILVEKMGLGFTVFVQAVVAMLGIAVTYIFLPKRALGTEGPSSRASNLMGDPEPRKTIAVVHQRS